MRMGACFVAVGLALAAQNPPPNDERPPRLKRGVPSRNDPARKGEPAPVSRPVPVAEGAEIVSDPEGRVVETRRPFSVPAGDPIIDKAKETAFEFSQSLPDFRCDQLTYRFSGEGYRKPDWKLQDRVTAEVLYVGGKESYRDIKINGKPLKKGAPEESGTWSTGEFGTVQLDVLSDSSRAVFRFLQGSQVDGRPAAKYFYRIEQPNSHWKVNFQGRPIFPAYRGSIWIDKENHRVLRIEMEAKPIPQDYPLTVVEMTVDYGLVRIAGRQYVLPVKAENLSCFRDSVTCTRNQLEFRNYRKFSAESTISTTDSTVSFDGEDKAPAPPAAPPPKKKK